MGNAWNTSRSGKLTREWRILRTLAQQAQSATHAGSGEKGQSSCVNRTRKIERFPAIYKQPDLLPLDMTIHVFIEAQGNDTVVLKSGYVDELVCAGYLLIFV